MQPFSRMLTYFVAVARQGSVRKASEQLNVSASAIDRQILSAEEQLGVALFNRLPSGMQLSAAGELLMRGALDWQRDYAAIGEQMDALSGLRRGHVKIALIEAMTSGFLPQLLATMRHDYPGITTDTRVLPNERIAAAIANGDAEIGILLNPPPLKELTIRAFREVPFGIVVPPGHALEGAPQLNFSSLSQFDLIRPQEPLAIAGHWRALEAARGAIISSAAASNNIALIKALVMQGVGITLLSLLDVASEVAQGKLLFIPLADAALRPATLALCHRAQGQLSRAARELVQRFDERDSWHTL